MNDGPKVDYTITVYQPDELGNVYIRSSVPGLNLYGPDLQKLLADAPACVAMLRSGNGDERERFAPGDRVVWMRKQPSGLRGDYLATFIRRFDTGICQIQVDGKYGVTDVRDYSLRAATEDDQRRLSVEVSGDM